MSKKINWHRETLFKVCDDLIEKDEEALREEHENSLEILINKGYQGLSHEVRAVIPKKKTDGFLSTFDGQRIQRIAANCIIVESVFGRETQH